MYSSSGYEGLDSYYYTDEFYDTDRLYNHSNSHISEHNSFDEEEGLERFSEHNSFDDEEGLESFSDSYSTSSMSSRQRSLDQTDIDFQSPLDERNETQINNTDHIPLNISPYETFDESLRSTNSSVISRQNTLNTARTRSSSSNRSRNNARTRSENTISSNMPYASQIITIHDNPDSTSSVNQISIDLSSSLSENESTNNRFIETINADDYTRNTNNIRNSRRRPTTNSRLADTSPVRITRIERRAENNSLRAPGSRIQNILLPVNPRANTLSTNSSMQPLSLNNALANFIFFGSLVDSSDNSYIPRRSFGTLTDLHPRVVARVNNRSVFGSIMRSSNSYLINFSSEPLDLEDIPLNQTKTMTFIRVSDTQSYLSSETPNTRVIRRDNSLILLINGNDNLTFICSNVLAQPNYSLIGSEALARFLDGLDTDSLNLSDNSLAYQLLLVFDEMEASDNISIRSKLIAKRKISAKESMVAGLGTHSRDIPIQNSDEYYNGDSFQNNSPSKNKKDENSQMIIVCNKCFNEFMSNTTIMASSCGHPMCHNCYSEYKTKFILCPSCNSRVSKSNFIKVFHS
ncbi:hypothetical protein BB561_000148 [Smittium simulii]|uniref:RING-type domain-containing protein n=1 Tax=Smittium simulii TaxID=133385 RepID=A0A2T9Z0E9_9FUNG|nr:hypothetical protein BB561_000148 [Smittium simulii]